MDRPSTLNATFVRQVKLPGRYGDGRGGHGLSLLVKPMANGRTSKTWSQRYYVSGRPVMLGLGAYPVVTLAAARAKALENRRALAEGRDPRGSRAVTFEQAAERTITLHADGWRNPRNRRPLAQHPAALRIPDHREQARRRSHHRRRPPPSSDRSGSTATNKPGRPSGECAPSCAGASPRACGPTTPLPQSLPRCPRPTASWNTTPRYPPTRSAPPSRPCEPAAHTPATKAAFELIALCGVRSGEARLATWAEVDFDAEVWTIDGSRTKTSAAQRIPLSRRAVEVLRDAHGRTGGEGYVFPGPSGRPLSDAAMSKLLRELGIDGTVHGLRSTLRSWMAEQGVPRDLAEMSLGHAVAGVEAAYMRSDLLERRREVLQRWADYIAN